MQEGVKAKLSKIKKLETGERKLTAKDRPQHFLMAPRCQVRDLGEEKPELVASAHDKEFHIRSRRACKMLGLI